MKEEIKSLIQDFSKGDLIVIFSQSLDNKGKIFDNIYKANNLFMGLHKKSQNPNLKLEQIIKNLKTFAVNVNIPVIIFIDYSSKEYFNIVEPYCDILIIQKNGNSITELDIRKHRRNSTKVIKISDE